MAQSTFTPEQSAQLQSEIQHELERREWAEPGDLVMAEYITVMLVVGTDFDPQFLNWLFGLADGVRHSAREPSPSPAATEPHRGAAPSGPSSRMFASAIEGTKRKYDSGRDGRDEQNKRRISDGPASRPANGAAGVELLPRAPTGPRAQAGGPSLSDRLGPRPPRMNVRGAGPRGGMPFRQQPQSFGMMPGFSPFMPGQQEMMMQMMAMQASMAHMADQMNQMSQQAPPTPPVRPAVRPSSRVPPVKVPPGTKLGSHAVSSVPPKATVGPIPDKPTSKALCKYSVGCSNARCPYSHPSPAANESALVLSEEACEAGKACKDGECVKSHVSPAAVLGGTAGPSRMLCKYQNCTNPSCAYRHEDESGKPIPPPALTAIKAAKPHVSASSDGEDDVEVVVSAKRAMDGVLGDSKTAKPCRYGEQCTRADCIFTHPPSRRLKSNGQAAIGSAAHKSKKFGVAADLNPAATEFKPAKLAAPVEGEMKVVS